MVAVMTSTSAPEAHLRGRARVLSEARKLFSTHGYTAVSMQQIADAAGINKATLYHHFRDKEDLFVAVMAEEFGQLAIGMSGVMAEEASVRDQLRRAAEFVFRSSQSDFGRLLLDLRQNVSIARRDAFMAECPLPWQEIRTAIARAIETGEVRPVDPDLAARLFFVAIISQLWLPAFGAERRELDDRLAETLVGILLDGIATDHLPRRW
jgi:AcrR family transcriptional regulator